jgi:hypothetical protein
MKMKMLSATVKTKKTEEAFPDWENTITYLSPNKILCPFSDNCLGPCLKSSGRLPMSKAQQNERTKLFFQEPEIFFYMLSSELVKKKKSAERKGKKLAYRFNGTSDSFTVVKKFLDSETKPVDKLYDYTKDFSRVLNYQGYKGYHLTFSFDGLNSNESSYLLKNSIANVAVVFNVKKDAPLPSHYDFGGVSYPVLDGDSHDLRFTDPTQHVVGLRAKGKAIKNGGDFVAKV